MMLLVGLGNPEQKYAKNRHNIGFMAVDDIVYRHSFAPYKKQFQGLVSSGTIDGAKILVLKPETYMNNSGRSVAECAKFYKIPPENIYVFHDELDLPLGKFRLKQGGGHGGHNGLRDIDNHMGKNYHRIRMGIDHPGHKDLVSGYVLSDFAKSEQQTVDNMIWTCSRHLTLLVGGDATNYMSQMALDMKG